MPVSEETYQRVALEDPEGQWELVCGRLRQKPIMTTGHNEIIDRLYRRLVSQLDEQDFAIRTSTGRVRRPTGENYLPDLFVVPCAFVQRLQAQPGTFEAYTDPLPLVVEVWSRSTGTYDVEQKLKDYQQRGDAEIWRIHPYDKTLTTWRRQPDGSYTETLRREGTIQPVALPNVTIDIPRLFE